MILPNYNELVKTNVYQTWLATEFRVSTCYRRDDDDDDGDSTVRRRRVVHVLMLANLKKVSFGHA